MDCSMPVMDGYEATARIRRTQHHTWTAIVALKANHSPENIMQCQAYEMDDFVYTKP